MFHLYYKIIDKSIQLYQFTRFIAFEIGIITECITQCLNSIDSKEIGHRIKKQEFKLNWILNLMKFINFTGIGLYLNLYVTILFLQLNFGTRGDHRLNTRCSTKYLESSNHTLSSASFTIRQCFPDINLFSLCAKSHAANRTEQ